MVYRTGGDGQRLMLVGIDEVGRGCLAGPLVAAAVWLRQPVLGLKDSKLLSRNQRQNLAAMIDRSGQVGLGWVWPSQIDALGLTAATTLAMRTALAQLKVRYDELIIDGNLNYLPDNPFARTMVKADRLVPAVSAASIVAKVARDNYMFEQALIYPDYHFEKHVGYGTRLHLEKLRLHGVCELHRLSFRPTGNVLP